METNNIEPNAPQSFELARVSDAASMVESIDRFVSTGNEQYFYLKDEKGLELFTTLVGHQQVSSEDIIAWHYSATANEVLEKGNTTIAFEGTRAITDLFQRIGNIGVNLEFVNDFAVKMAVALGEESMVRYKFEINSAAVVCEECDQSTDPIIIEELSLNEGRYGCGHADDEYFSNYSATLTHRISPEAALNHISSGF
jgi:hypothetical protein